MQTSPNSVNITTFRVAAEFDLYNRKVIFTDTSIYAGSSGSGIFNVLGISFLLQDQEGIDLATIDFSNPAKYIVPSVTREFEVDLSSMSFPFLFQTYKIQAAIKDADGSVYYTDVVFKKICQPQNMTESGYVPGIFQVLANCPDNVLTIKDLTVFTYNNLTPVQTTKSGTLSYPTGTQAAVSFTGTPWSNNVIYTGQYRVACTTVSEYDMGDEVSVLVTYLTNNVFDITCANRIADLICCMVELQKTYLKNCNTAVGKNAKQKLDDITVPFLVGLAKEINGQDASKEADIIKKALNCDCGATSLRQNEFTPINPSSTNIVIAGVGGTTIPSPTINGNTKTYNIASSIYQVVKGNTFDLAFAIEVDTSVTNTVKYKITFNYNTLASYILNAISGDANLLTILNSLITSTGGVSLAGLDGKCVIDLTDINYFMTQSVNAATLVSSISTTTQDYPAPASYFASDPATVQSWLNGLGIGTFTVTYNNGVFSVLSLSNTFNLSSISFSNPSLTVVFQKTNKTLVDVLQAVIDYLCTLTALQVTLGNTITLWQIDYNGTAVSQSFTSGQSQQALNQAIANSIYNIVQTISTLTGLTCAKISALFQDYPSVAFGASDRLYGTLGGNCASLTDKQIATLVIAAINKYSDVKDSFCAIDCEAPGSCPEISGIQLAMVGNNIGVYGVSFASTPTQAQSLSVYYKRNNQATYTLVTSNLQVLPNGSINGTSPIQLVATQGVTYDVKIVNNCGGNGYVQQISVPTGSAYTGSYLRDSILYTLCGGSPVTLYTGQVFGVGVVVFTDSGLLSPLTGYNYIADYSTGQIYTIDSATGEVLADTGSSCSTGVANKVMLDNSTATICAVSPAIVRYTNGLLATGKTLYLDASLTSPVTGYSYMLDAVSGNIYNINSITGVIGALTGLTCSAFESEVKLDNSDLTVCGAATTSVYSSGAFNIGVTLYNDAGLTSVVTGYSFVELSGTIYNLNPATGVVISEFGFCS